PTPSAGAGREAQRPPPFGRGTKARRPPSSTVAETAGGTEARSTNLAVAAGGVGWFAGCADGSACADVRTIRNGVYRTGRHAGQRCAGARRHHGSRTSPRLRAH